MTKAWLAVLVSATLSGSAVAGDKSMSVGPTVEGPPAFRAFCAANAASCRPVHVTSRPLHLDKGRLDQLDAINRKVNRTVVEVADDAHFGRQDVWQLPRGGVGDCEDFVLQKREELIAAGWPSSSLLVTIVRTKEWDGHAVLTVVTAEGDFVLDSKTNAILNWSETPYTYFIRQDSRDPRGWRAIGRRPVAQITAGR